MRGCLDGSLHNCVYIGKYSFKTESVGIDTKQQMTQSLSVPQQSLKDHSMSLPSQTIKSKYSYMYSTNISEYASPCHKYNEVKRCTVHDCML